jgi:hypothetical protein
MFLVLPASIIIVASAQFLLPFLWLHSFPDLSHNILYYIDLWRIGTWIKLCSAVVSV